MEGSTNQQRWQAAPGSSAPLVASVSKNPLLTVSSGQLSSRMMGVGGCSSWAAGQQEHSTQEAEQHAEEGSNQLQRRFGTQRSAARRGRARKRGQRPPRPTLCRVYLRPQLPQLLSQPLGVFV